MKDNAKSVTMKDIAAATNLSAAAVSMALRGNSSIPLATQERVRKVADELGYKKNPMLMALASQRSQKPRVLAFITNEASMETFRSRQFLHLFYHGFSKQARTMGFSPELIFVSDEDEDAQSLEERMEGLDCKACVLGAIDPSACLPELNWSKYSIVQIDSLFLGLDSPLVTNDQLQGIRLAYSELREIGYRRIGLVTGDVDELATSDAYSAGYMIESLRADSEHDVPPLFFKIGSSFESQTELLAEWVRENRVEAIVSNWSGIVERAGQAGLKIPENVAFAGLCLESAHGELAGVVQSHEAVGKRAAEVLAARVNAGQVGEDAQAVSTYVKGYWVHGESAPSLSVAVAS